MLINEFKDFKADILKKNSDIDKKIELLLKEKEQNQLMLAKKENETIESYNKMIESLKISKNINDEVISLIEKIDNVFNKEKSNENLIQLDENESHEEFLEEDDMKYSSSLEDEAFVGYSDPNYDFDDF